MEYKNVLSASSSISLVHLVMYWAKPKMSFPCDCGKVVTVVLFLTANVFGLMHGPYHVVKKKHASVPPLTVAASHGSIQQMIALIDAGADVNELDWLGQTPLHMAAKFQQRLAAHILLDRGANCCIANIDFQETPLHLAAKTGSIDIITMLLKRGANINSNIARSIIPGGTPLLYSGLYDATSFKTAKILLDHGADVTALNSYGQTALHLYAESLNLRTVAVMVNRFKAKVDTLNESGCSPLNVISKKSPGSANQLAIASFLLDTGANPNSRCFGSDGPPGSQRTALHSAVIHANKPLLELLLQYGAQVDIVDYSGRSPLYIAVAILEKINNDIIKTLLERGANPNLRPNSQQPCSLMLSVFLRRKLPINNVTSNVVRTLIDYGAERDMSCQDDGTVLVAQYLAQAQTFPQADMRLHHVKKSDSDVQNASNHWVTVELMRAASFGDAFTITVLLEQYSNAIINNRDSFRRTALHWAATGEYTVVTKALLAGGANVNAVDAEGHTPIMHAAITGNTGVIKILLNRGADIKGQKGATALKLAVERSNSPEAVEIFLKSGVAIGSNEHPPLLHTATLKQNIRMMQILIAHGAYIDILMPESGQSPLSSLIQSDCCYPQLPVLELLLQRGANINRRDSQGRTALLTAIMVRRRKEVIRFLLDHGANPNIPNFYNCNTPLFALVGLASQESHRFHLHSLAPDNLKEVVEIARDLVARGANPDLRDPCVNRTARQMAYDKKIPIFTH